MAKPQDPAFKDPGRRANGTFAPGNTASTQNKGKRQDAQSSRSFQSAEVQKFYQRTRRRLHRIVGLPWKFADAEAGVAAEHHATLRYYDSIDQDSPEWRRGRQERLNAGSFIRDVEARIAAAQAEAAPPPTPETPFQRALREQAAELDGKDGKAPQ